LQPQSLLYNLTGSGLDRREPLISWGLLPFCYLLIPFFWHSGLHPFAPQLLWHW
jgi:hypothetical protein